MIDESVLSPIIKVRGGVHHESLDVVVREIAVTLYFNKEEIVTVLCSPNYVKEMMVGFLLSEGFVQDRSHIYTLGYHCEENVVRVEGKAQPLQKERMNRRVMSACCGKSRASFNFENDSCLLRVQESNVTLSLDHVVCYANYLDKNSSLFKETGGIHNGGVAFAGEVLYTCYDIGRHNVLDKILGRACLLGLDLTDHVLFISGRVSSEILLKVAKMNIPILVARSAPTDLALAFAEDLNITVIGFARGDGLNIYTCPERVVYS